MIMTYGTFVGLAGFLLLLCCFCGLKGRYKLFMALAFMGLCMQSIYLSGSLKVAPFEPLAITALGAGLICGVISFLAGRFFGRIQAAWLDSRVRDDSI